MITENVTVFMTLPHEIVKITLLLQPHPLDVSQPLPLNYNYYDAFPHLIVQLTV